MRRRWIAGVALAALAGCSETPAERFLDLLERGEETPANGEREPPPGAIPYRAEIWMVPAEPGADGCRLYTQWSATLMVNRAIYYRTADGGFTTDSSRSACETP